MEAKTSKSGYAHQLSSLNVGGQFYGTTISRNYTVNGRAKYLSLHLTREETVSLCAALLGCLSDAKEEQAIVDRGSCGNVTKRYPSRKVYSDESKRKLSDHQMHERNPVDDPVFFATSRDGGTLEPVCRLYSIKGKLVDTINYDGANLPDICLGLTKLEGLDA